MKHLYLFIFLTLCSPPDGVYAQWEWGLKGGVSISHVIKKQNGQDQSRWDLLGSKLIGLTLSRPLGRRFRLHQELQFATYGAPRNGRAVSYLWMPYEVYDDAVLTMYHAGLSAKAQYYPAARFFVAAGMEVAALLQDNRVTPWSLEPLEYRVLYGLGYALLPHLSFELRYNRSLSPFLERGGDARFATRMRHYNHAIQASLEYRFQGQSKQERSVKNSAPALEWGGMAILNFTNFVFYLQGSPTFREQFEDNPMLVSKGVGLFLRRPVSARTLLHTEFAYTTRGGRGQARTGIDQTANLMLSYLSLAMAYEYIPWNKLGLQLGVEGARRLGSTYELWREDAIRRLDASLLAGCRLALPEVSFTLRYARGLTPVIDARGDFRSVRQFNQRVELLASVPFMR